MCQFGDLPANHLPKNSAVSGDLVIPVFIATRARINWVTGRKACELV